MRGCEKQPLHLQQFARNSVCQQRKMHHRLNVSVTPNYLSFSAALLFANFSCHLLTFGGPLESTCTINSIVSSILAIVVTEGCGVKVAGSSSSVGSVRDGLSTMIGLDVFFWRIWYFLSPVHRIAYPGVVAVGAEEVIEILLGMLAIV